ncbi:GNAT family N-acetyltransferase [Streptomyces pinistramenti]|uniref:GNAT family N-acetyltransferase n=1 Tax=Streptomyces pinistramenti TaxID=2884812 RepID=UPI001D084FCE|nr:GNAT family N-acetyltransferase [Streptomyces pinistramenti]MCB5912282.1 GNAT family N-acetyltransferase [Streptomyces pinistramenti]
MTLTLRDFRPSDAKAVADLRHAVLPHLISTPRGISWHVASAAPAQRLRLFVAVLDGRVAGCVISGLVHDSSVPGQAVATPCVHPGHRRAGIGGALLSAAEEHLAAAGAERVFAWASDTAGARAFAERRGYRRTRPARYLRLGLAGAALPPPGDLPPGVRLHTGADFGADPYPLFRADAEVTADEPGDAARDAMAYEDWLRHTWEHPDNDLQLTSVVTVDGEIAAFSLATTDGIGRYSSGMTGTRRAFRGRGLARLAKTDSLRRARDAGCTEALTGNDASNAPMAAINQSLGYRTCATEWRCVREPARG